ncbi:proline-rich receptor-like protein kinase PERK3 isoform X2 [Silene latifolia]|uniref:proline-rich receptor-like protein kinase PERK3 isoform X2 n=1 Tax=Silene latifolia TaxID=37657 RepID=UPI003D76A62A
MSIRENFSSSSSSFLKSTHPFFIPALNRLVNECLASSLHQFLELGIQGFDASWWSGGAVKVLASNSRQGEKEFQTEVSLLGRLHHRNLVNLVGYCVENGQYMLIYEYMSNGSLDRFIYMQLRGFLQFLLRVKQSSRFFLHSSSNFQTPRKQELLALALQENHFER